MSQKIDIDRLVVFKELKSMFGVPYSKMHLSRLEREGKFPRRSHLSPNRAVWNAKEISEWVGDRLSQKPATDSGLQG